MLGGDIAIVLWTMGLALLELGRCLTSDRLESFVALVFDH